MARQRRWCAGAHLDDVRDVMTRRRAGVLRKQMTPPELRLWLQLRQRPGGLRWRRQHPCPPYVLDFFCAGRAVCVEVDGSGHLSDQQAEHDRRRDGFLLRRGVTVLRVEAHAVRDELEAVVAWIVAEAESPMAARVERYAETYGVLTAAP